MINASFEWYGDFAYTALVGEAWNRIKRAADFYWQMLQRNALNTPNTGKLVPFPDDGRWGERMVYPNASKPGQPPHKITSKGAKAVKTEYDKENLTVRVGIDGKDAKYMLFLELGTRSTVRIMARAAKALAIFAGDGRDWVRLSMLDRPTQWIFRKSVLKYPQKPHPFLLPTLKKYLAQIAAMAGANP